MNNEKSRKLNMIMNELSVNKNDPSKVNFSMIILDDSVSGNNVKVTDIALESLAKSVKGMPVVAKLIQNKFDNSLDDFGDHQAVMGKTRNGEDFIDRDTVAIGAFTSEGYIVTETVNDEEVKLLKGEGVLWATRYPDIVNLILEMDSNNIKLNSSSEYLYGEKNVSFNEENVEIHDGDIYFEGIAVLGSDSNYVAPAYESATFTMLNEANINDLNLLVAQALEKEKGDEILKTKLNKISYDSIREQAQKQITPTLGDYDYSWISDVTTEDVVIFAETDIDEYGYFQYNYTIDNDVVTVDLDSKKEVIKTNEWKVINESINEKVDELNSQLNEIKVEKVNIAKSLDDANTVISQLNEKVDTLTALNAELEPFKIQVESALKEEKVLEVKNTFESKFNSVDGAEVFATEEIQALLLNAIEEGEVGLNAKLQLNEKVLELASIKLEATKSPTETLLNSMKKRDFSNIITEKENDILASLR